MEKTTVNYKEIASLVKSGLFELGATNVEREDIKKVAYFVRYALDKGVNKYYISEKEAPESWHTLAKHSSLKRELELTLACEFRVDEYQSLAEAVLDAAAIYLGL